MLKAGIKTILDRAASSIPSPATPPCSDCSSLKSRRTITANGRNSDYTFYDTMAYHLHDLGVICEPDFPRALVHVRGGHGLQASCLTDTLKAVETAVDLTLEQVEARRKQRHDRATTPSSSVVATTGW